MPSRILWTASLFVVAVAVGFAGPNTITYQGCVVSGGGAPVADGSYSMRFRVYDAVSGGALRWEETDVGVVVTSGLFSATLGDGTVLQGKALADGQRPVTLMAVPCYAWANREKGAMTVWMGEEM